MKSSSRLSQSGYSSSSDSDSEHDGPQTSTASAASISIAGKRRSRNYTRSKWHFMKTSFLVAKPVIFYQKLLVLWLAGMGQHHQCIVPVCI